jgi:hypothetical protein
VIIGWADWNKVQPFAMSGWAIPGQALPRATAPTTKWHLRMNLRGGPPVYLNVQLDPMRKRSTVTHEAAVRAGETFHSFYMLFVRTEASEVGNLVGAGADAVVRADRWRLSDPTERGPDILLDATDTRNMAKYLRVGWKSEEEIGGRSEYPISGQWHGKLKAREVIRDTGWIVRGVREDRQVREGHRHEGDVQYHQGANNHPALGSCEAGTEGERRTGMVGSPGRGPEIQQLRV